MKLTVRDTPNESVNVAKNNVLVNLVLHPVLLKSVFSGKLYSTKLGLYDDRSFLGCRGKIDFDGKFNSRG